MNSDINNNNNNDGVDKQQQQIIDKLETLTLNNNIDATPALPHQYLPPDQAQNVYTQTQYIATASPSQYNTVAPTTTGVQYNNDQNALNQSVEISMDSIGGSSTPPSNWFENISKYRDRAHDTLMSAIHPQNDLAQYYDSNNLQINKVAPPHTIDQSVLFSSYALPNRHELLNKSALPTGLMLSPFDRPVVVPTSSDFYPPTCKKCQAYLNIYCKLEYDLQIQVPQWICAVCRTGNHIDSGTKGVRSIWDVKQGLGWWATDGYQTVLQNDHYDIKKRRKFNQQQTKPSSTSTSSTTETLSSDAISAPMYSENSNDNATSVNQQQPNSPTQSQAIATHPDVYIFVVDENLPVEELEIIEKSAQQLLAKLPQESMVALISFQKIVSLYEMSSSSLFSASKVIYGGQSINSSTAFSLKLKRKLFLESLSASEQRFTQNFQTLIETQSTSPASGICSLGVAIEAALTLITSSTSNGGRIFVFLNQAPNFGPGSIGSSTVGAASAGNNVGGGGTSVPHQSQDDDQSADYVSSEYYRLLGERAYRKSIAIDLHMIGFNDFSSRILSPLVFPTGQMFISHDLNDTDRTEMLFQNMYNSILKNSGIYARLDIHCPEPINLTHLIGPTTKINQQQSYINDIDNSKSDGFCSISVELTNLQQDVSLSLFYDLQEDIPQDYIYFQFVIHLLDESENRILRVITKRIKTTGNFNRFIDSLDLNVSSVLLSKKLILDYKKSNAQDYDFKDKLDKQLKLISTRCANVEKGWFRNTITIPDTIKQFIKKMYIVREGVLFGSIIQNHDDFETLCSLFINTNFTDSMRIILPKLILSDQNDQLLELLHRSDNIESNRVLVYDAQTHIYLFVGSEVTKDSSAEMYARSFIEKQVIHRVPLPYILTFNENEHSIRWLKARLQVGSMEEENYYHSITIK